MEREKIIFWRDLLLRMFVIGLVVALLILGGTVAFWNTAARVVMHLFLVDEKALGRLSPSLSLSMSGSSSSFSSSCPRLRCTG